MDNIIVSTSPSSITGLSSYQKRSITLEITLTDGVSTFAASGTNKLSITGLRIVAEVINAGGLQAPELTCSVYGLPEQDMNTLTLITLDYIGNQVKAANQGAVSNGVIPYIRNTIAMWADGYLVYDGDIVDCWGDYTAAPDVCLYIRAMTGYAERISKAPATSLSNPKPIADIVQGLCNYMGIDFENNGVTAIAQPYLAGSAIQQLNALATNYNFALVWEPVTTGSKLIISPKEKPRIQYLALIDAYSGLIGWPTFDKIGVHFHCLFNPNIRFQGLIQVNSSNTRANGQWIVTHISYFLESEKPDGAWFMRVTASWPYNS
jgi:hypothetical protein